MNYKPDSIFITLAAVVAVFAFGYGVRKAKAATVVEDEHFYHWSGADFDMDGKVDLEDWAFGRLGEVTL